MPNRHKAIRIAAFVSAVQIATVFSGGAGRAQQAEETVFRNHVTVTQADIDAAAAVRYSSFHVMAASIPGAREKARALNEENARRAAELEGAKMEREGSLPETTLVQPYFYPADVSKGSKTGATLASAVNHAVYINLPSKTTIEQEWGNPEGFLQDLFKSTFIHLADQYTGSTTDNYTVGKSAMTTYTLYAGGNVIYEHELWAIVHAVIKSNPAVYGTGLGHIYHLFLPNGLDTCFDESTECYSPDNFDDWFFCAYHDYVQFKDIGTVLLTVEPYQNVDGCAVSQPTPNGKLIDSTDSVLGHETFETITDPEPPSGFTNQISLDEEGAEIADECQPVTDDNGDFLVPTFKINEKKYAVQLMYSNTYHACAAQP
jgi:hypothetical protein